MLDIGANVGQFGRMVRTAGFGGRIISVEPLATAYRQLSRRAAADPQWQCISSAVGAAPGATQINVSANSYSSSLLTMTRQHLAADPESHVIGTQDVDVVTVADLVAAHEVEPARTLLKIDTQGYEQQVIDGAGALVDEFAAIQLELSFVELYEGQRLYGDLVEQMAGHGLTMWSIETGISDDAGRLLQCDGLFLRSNHGR
ncbi:FkbM family methyltransferase [Aeromicrobium sp. UC242_57]|uniref:FkbM family methyltransferase n=1 Tax=Aeromicrobium sp. UC242_57 TaxID=3374624 RepID=UPI003797F2C6